MKLPRNYGLGLFYRLELRDRQGNLVWRSRWRKSRSYVLQFLKHIKSAMENVNVSTKATNGTTYTIRRPDYGPYYFMVAWAGEDTDAYGIVVGTGTTAAANDDYKLESQCTQGTGANQFDHGAMEEEADVAVVGSNVDWVIRRSFYNLSGSDITVGEVGIYVRTKCTDDNVHDFCIVRDVLASPVTVSDGYTLTVKYTLRTTV